MGEESVRIYNSFIFLPGEKDKIGKLKEKFHEYFVPKKNTTYERYKFFTYRQGTEKLEQFITHLKNQAHQCEFGTPELTEELTTTMLIIGINDEAVRGKLLQEAGKTTLAKAIETCIITETSRQQLQDMKDKEHRQQAGASTSFNTTEIDAVKKKTTSFPANSSTASYGRQSYQPNRGQQMSRTGSSHSGRYSQRFANSNNNRMINNCVKCGRNHLINVQHMEDIVTYAKFLTTLQMFVEIKTKKLM